MLAGSVLNILKWQQICLSDLGSNRADTNRSHFPCRGSISRLQLTAKLAHLTALIRMQQWKKTNGHWILALRGVPLDLGALDMRCRVSAPTSAKGLAEIRTLNVKSPIREDHLNRLGSSMQNVWVS